MSGFEPQLHLAGRDARRNGLSPKPPAEAGTVLVTGGGGYNIRWLELLQEVGPNVGQFGSVL